MGYWYCFKLVFWVIWVVYEVCFFVLFVRFRVYIRNKMIYIVILIEVWKIVEGEFD